MIRPEIKEQLDTLAMGIKDLADEFRNDPSPDTQFLSGAVGQIVNQLDMAVSNQYGIKLCLKKPNPVAEVQEPKPKKK